MMQTHPVLRLKRQQFTQLATYCTAYRAYLWRCLLPSPQRNQALRSIQRLQARLDQMREQEQAEFVCFLNAEEGTTLKQLCLVLMQQYGGASPSDQRNQALGELASLRVLIERTVRQTQTL